MRIFKPLFSCTEVILVENCTGYRLPTEAEWEYGARAGTTTADANPLFFDPTQIDIGGGFNANLHAMGWYVFNMATSFPAGTKPVAQKQADRWGIYDMHGNVIEWCHDSWDRSDYPPTPVTDPIGTEGDDKNIRGGFYQQHAHNTRSANRFSTHPSHNFYGLGFRLVLPVTD